MRGRHVKLPFAGVLAAAALLAPGCGGDDDAPVVPVQGASGASGANGAAALSKPEFIRQADAICGEANAALDALDTGTTASDPKIRATQELQITRSELESLQSLTPPDQDRAALERFLSALKSEVASLARKKSAVDQGGDTASAEAALADSEGSAQAAAQDYGFKDCANAAAETPATPGAATPGAATTTPVAPAAPTAPAAPAAPAPPPAAPAPAGGGGGAPAGGTGSGTGGGSGGGGGGSGGVSP